MSILKPTSRLNRLRALRHTLQHKLDLSSRSERKARTRTLIQLGGLVHKCGLTERFGIALGEDLQLEVNSRDKAKRLEEWLEKL